MLNPSSKGRLLHPSKKRGLQKGMPPRVFFRVNNLIMTAKKPFVKCNYYFEFSFKSGPNQDCSSQFNNVLDIWDELTGFTN